MILNYLLNYLTACHGILDLLQSHPASRKKVYWRLQALHTMYAIHADELEVSAGFI